MGLIWSKLIYIFYWFVLVVEERKCTYSSASWKLSFILLYPASSYATYKWDSTVVIENYDVNLERVLQSDFETFEYQQIRSH